MKHIKILSVTAMLAFTVSTQAQSLDECRRLAREHYPEIRQYDLISQTEQFSLSNAARAWIPQVSFSAQATYQSATATYPEMLANMLTSNGVEVSGLRKDQYKVAIDVTQQIWDGGQTKANRAAIEAEAAEQRKATHVDLYELEARVDDIYFGILLLDERIAQGERKIELLKSNLEKVRSYCRNGVAMQADADMVEAELLTAKQALGQAQTSQESFRRLLEIFIGSPLTDQKLQRPEMRSLQSHVPARPELEWFDAQIDKLSAKEKSVTSSVMPKFSAFAQGYYGYPGLDMFKSMMSSDWTLNGMIGLRMSWNIGAFYTKKNSLRSLRTAREQVEVQRNIFQFNTQLHSTQEESEISRLRQVIADDERIADLRRSVRVAAESQLTNGIIDTTDLLQKITEETTAVLNRSTHEIELLQAVYKLKHTLNQ